jgi:hypothetical protein
VISKSFAGHLRTNRYGSFQLTDAIRPAPALPVIPTEGYRLEAYRDVKANVGIPVLVASVSRERLFEVFLALLAPLGEVVDVVLESSHHSVDSSHTDLYREQIDRPVLESCFCEFEDLLLNDGCTGVAVISAAPPMEVQFDEHKLLVAYAHELRDFERILRGFNIPRNDRMKLITEGEHLHTSDVRYMEAFEQMSYRLGAGHVSEAVSW